MEKLTQTIEIFELVCRGCGHIMHPKKNAKMRLILCSICRTYNANPFFNLKNKKETELIELQNKIADINAENIKRLYDAFKNAEYQEEQNAIRNQITILESEVFASVQLIKNKFKIETDDALEEFDSFSDAVDFIEKYNDID